MNLLAIVGVGFTVITFAIILLIMANKMLSNSGSKLDYMERPQKTWFGMSLFTEYRLTRDRLFVVKGVLNLREDKCRLWSIRDVSCSMTFVQRMFGMGTVHVLSGDQSLRDIDLVNVKQLEKVKEMLSTMVDTERNRNRVYVREVMNDDYTDSDEDGIPDRF